MATLLTVNYSFIKPNPFEEIDIWGPHLNANWDSVDSILKAHTDSLALKATLLSPIFTGVPAAPTAVPGTNTTQLATTGFVKAALDLKANIASPTFTGTVGGITAAMVGLGSVNNTTDLGKPVSTAQQAALDLKANLISPALTGTPSAPTPAPGNDTTLLATTAFVKAAITLAAPGGGREAIVLAVSDEITAIVAGVAKLTLRMPYGFLLTGIKASLSTAASALITTVDVNKNGISVLSTKLTIDALEKTSVTAAIPPVLSDWWLADDVEITVDIDIAGTGAKGLKVYLIGNQ